MNWQDAIVKVAELMLLEDGWLDEEGYAQKSYNSVILARFILYLNELSKLDFPAP